MSGREHTQRVKGIAAAAADLPEIQHRDKTCRWPGCSNTLGLEIHHEPPWPRGPTDTFHGLLLCVHHHQCRTGLKDDGVWARPYSQWVATRSRDPRLLAELRRRQAHGPAGGQWSDADFAPIAAEIDRVFRSFGWMQ